MKTNYLKDEATAKEWKDMTSKERKELFIGKPGERKDLFIGFVIMIVIVLFLFKMCSGSSSHTTTKVDRTHEETLQFILDVEQMERSKLGQFIKKAEGR